MSLQAIAQSLKNLPLGRCDSSPTSPTESATSKSDGKFFCIEDTFLSSEIQVSHNDVGPINFPIEEETIKNLISVSEKAKSGGGTKTNLDTSCCEAQMIPASKLNVEIDPGSLKNVLKRLEKELNMDENSKLELQLYNMLIYGKGQFSRDPEKVKNMVARLVIVLPSMHEGGDLLIYHRGSKHIFFGSSNPKVVKCVTFYADCYHEIEEVKEGYRVALTYNVELKCGLIPPVNESLKNAVNNYFKKEKVDKLLYYLDHQYHVQSLRWHLLKGKDQTRAKALLAVAKKENYVPCLALAEYNSAYKDITGIPSSGGKSVVEGETKLFFGIDEKNWSFNIGKIHVSEYEICYTKESFQPPETEDSGPSGNGGLGKEWYRPSYVVLWKDNWCFLHGYRIELTALHDLTTQPDMQNTLLEKIKDFGESFFNYNFWEDNKVKKMLLDIVIYLSNMEMTGKILKKLKPSDVFFDLTKVVTWISNTWNLELWKDLVDAWKKNYGFFTEKSISSLLPFLLQYVTKEDKNSQVTEYLFNEIANVFIKSMKMYCRSRYRPGRLYRIRLRSRDQNVCTFLQICHNLGKSDFEKELMENLK